MNTETKSNKAYLFSYNGFKYTYINESNNLSKTIQMYRHIIWTRKQSTNRKRFHWLNCSTKADLYKCLIKVGGFFKQRKKVTKVLPVTGN